MKSTSSRLTCSTGVVIGTLVLCVLACIASAIILATQLARGAKGNQPVRTAFTGSSQGLLSTTIVPTLDSPLPPSQNVIWSAAFVAASKQLAANTLHGPIEIKGTHGNAERLQNAPDPTLDLPTGGAFAVGGLADRNTLSKLKEELSRAMPGFQSSLDLAENSTPFAYAALQASIKITHPYFDYTERKPFRDSAGKDTPALFFGLRPEDASSYQALRSQAAVLYAEDAAGVSGSANVIASYAVDLCKDTPDTQVILTVTKQGKTLGEMVDHVLAKIEANIGKSTPLSANDTLQVPRISFSLDHHFSQLEGKMLKMPGGAETPLARAQEYISFRLDKGGEPPKIEAANLTNAIPQRYFFDRPFLLLLRKRGSRNPFFAMWVENAELIQKKP